MYFPNLVSRTPIFILNVLDGILVFYKIKDPNQTSHQASCVCTSHKKDTGLILVNICLTQKFKKEFSRFPLKTKKNTENVFDYKTKFA